MFGICTYNRKEILQRSISSLKNVDCLDSVDIIIFDDCSTEYDEKYLRDLIPFVSQIIVQPRNFGADKNTSDMYEFFCTSEYDWLFNADSDLIYSKDIVNKINEYKDTCNGFMTFFNCINHRDVGEKSGFVLKDEVGAAGCLLNKDIVKFILDKIKYRTTGFDVNFSRLLIQSGHDLICTKQSYVQHIGVVGFNSRNIKFDYGKYFVCEDQTNGEIVEETFERYMEIVGDFRSTSSFRIFNFIISIPRRIKKVFKIISGGKLN